MKYSKKEIRWFATMDMYSWVDNFENDETTIEGFNKKQQEIYWEYIKEIKKEVKRYIVILEERNK